LEERSVIHSTFVIERNYATSPERVFAAFADPVKKRRWFAEEEAPDGEFEMDFRVEGREHKRFGSKHGLDCRSDSVYLDIVPDRRIVFAYTMSLGDRRISASIATVELLAAQGGTDLIFTEQAAFFEGADGPVIREAGWRELLGRLAKDLSL